MTLHYNYTTKTLLISALMGISSWLTAGAAAPTDDPDTGAKSEETTGENSDMLNGPVEIPGEADDIDIPIPSFIHMNANHIMEPTGAGSARRFSKVPYLRCRSYTSETRTYRPT